MPQLPRLRPRTLKVTDDNYSLLIKIIQLKTLQFSPSSEWKVGCNCEFSDKDSIYAVLTLLKEPRGMFLEQGNYNLIRSLTTWKNWWKLFEASRFHLLLKEEDGEAETGSSSEEPWSETELGIDELQLLLQAMQFRRSVTLNVNVNALGNSVMNW